MSGLLLCSKQSEVPYHVEGLNVNLYSVEELCYYLYNHIYLVEDDFFCISLADFMEQEWNLPKTAQRLRECIQNNASFAEMVMLLLHSTSYYVQPELEKIKEILSVIGQRTSIERMKARADVYMTYRKYKSALETYRSILAKKEHSMGETFYADIWNNIGVIYVRLFLFEEAKSAFETSYELEKREDILRKLVTIYLILEEEIPLLKLVAKYEIPEELIEETKAGIQKEKKRFMEEEEYVNIEKSLQFESGQQVHSYYEELQTIIDTWKADYREEMA